MEERYRFQDKENRLPAPLSGLEENCKTHAEGELFLVAIEEGAERAGLQDKLYELSICQMSITLATGCHRLSGNKLPSLSRTYEGLVHAMVDRVPTGKPEGHFLTEIRTSEAGKMSLQPLREELDRIYQTYVALCHRNRTIPVITEQIALEIYLRYLPEDLGTQARHVPSYGDADTFYAADKFGAPREDRRTTHSMLWDARGLTRDSGDVTGLLMFTGELSGNRDPVVADRELRASSLCMTMGGNRAGAPFHEEAARPPVPGRRR